MPKFVRYQDYVIKDGRLVGEFEQMYRDFNDPWEQSTRELGAHEKVVGLEILKSNQLNRIIELGCGLGDYTSRIAEISENVLGIDVSETAVNKACSKYDHIKFSQGDILDFDLYRQFKPDCIVLAEISWYVLEKLPAFFKFLKEEMSGVSILHLLMTYAEGEQKYGKEYFSNLKEIMSYWDVVDFEQWGTISHCTYNGGARTYCFGRVR